MGINRCAILRLEQIYPFPEKRLKEIIKSYPWLRQLRWVQEEPRNKGSWSFVQERLNALGDRTWSYVGRPASASSSTGAHVKNTQEMEDFLREAFDEVNDL